jgi:hypothetical protein
MKKNAKDIPWKRTSSGSIVQLDLQVEKLAKTGELSRTSEYILRTLKDLEASNWLSTTQEWERLLARLPKELLNILIQELEHGNVITGIGQPNWPQKESVIVNIMNRFSERDWYLIPQVKWTNLNDPHYWREDVAQAAFGVTHYLIA